MNTASKSAFTLFELLITISVIVLITAIGFATLGTGDDARRLDRAANMLHSMVRVARTQAIMNSAHARLIVHNDPSERDLYLRKIGVVIEDKDQQGLWRAVERGVMLPEGVFVVPQGGDGIPVSFSADWPTDTRRSIYKVVNSETALDGAVFHYWYPLKELVNEADATAPKWLAIQFAPNGRLSSAKRGGGGLPPASNQLVLAAGNWRGDAVQFRKPEQFEAIAFKLSGSSYNTTESELVDYVPPDDDES